MTYDEAVDYWFGRINFEHKTPRPNDLSLDRIRALLELLRRPQDRFRIVHVAGSKGKGSTSAMLASILYAAGYRVGLFTSPHLDSVAERIRVDDVPITQPEMATILTDIAAVSRATRLLDGSTLDEVLTFFEISTALGYLHFARRRVEWAVVEVGMGGRFDSTNVCRPAVAVITSISLDHVRQLGDTLALIAGEKAGIIKPGRPTVSGVRAAEPREVIRAVCRARSSTLMELGRDFRYEYVPRPFRDGRPAYGEVTIHTKRRAWPGMTLPLLGDHQAANAAVAVATIETLRGQGTPIPDRAVVEGLARVQWAARMECMRQAPVVLLDCAHNVDSAQALLQTLDAFYPKSPPGQRILVFAGSRDKDLPGMLALLHPAFDRILFTQFTSTGRATPPTEMAAMLSASSSASIELFDTPQAAWLRARAIATPSDLICVTGSVFLAGELRPIILHDQEEQR